VTVVQFDSHTRKSPEAWVAPQLAVIVPSYNERENVALLYEKVTAALGSTPFEFIVVDDNSPDGTHDVVREMSRQHQNVRGIHRLGRRGLSSAVVEGILASAAPYFAVIDADLQHDERILPQLLEKAIAGDHIVVGTRYSGEGSVGEGLSKTREAGSRFATKLSNLLTGKTLSDPMSGFFLMRRDVFDEVAPSLSDDGFKILLDIIVSAGRFHALHGRELRIGEVPYTFRPRHAGESKMSSLVVLQFLGLIVSKLSGGLLPTTFLLFGLVGGFGVVVHMATLGFTHEVLKFNFVWAQVAATLVAMTFNFMLNNELTYANKKLRGWRYITGMLTFYAVCSIGALANVSVASWIYAYDGQFYVAGLLGVLMSVVFNYSVTKVFTWR
jgi:dolichol-phosphate mannosyltransferase